MRCARATERGSGLLSAVIGVAAVLALLGLCVNVALGLWTRSTIDAVAHDAAREVAAAPRGADLSSRASVASLRAREVLGPIADEVQLDFEQLGEDGSITLRVRAPGVALLPRMVSSGPVVGALDRRIVLRREDR